MKEIKLKLFYVISMLVFMVINTHAYAFFSELLLPLAKTPYTTGTNLAGDIFLVMVIFTMIVSIADILLLKKLNRQKMSLFLMLALGNTACIGIGMWIRLLWYNFNSEPVSGPFNLFDGTVIGLYLLKESVLYAIFKNKIAEAN
jgi:hypothetical protein